MGKSTYASVVKSNMADIIIVIFFVSVFVGLDKPLYGLLAGLVLSIGYCFLINNLDTNQWVLYPIVGSLIGFMIPICVRWLFSGLRGGRGKSEPGVSTYIGGFGVGRAGQYFGKWSEGIVPTENEETGWQENKEEKRERFIGILIRYLLAPIIIILIFILYSLLKN